MWLSWLICLICFYPLKIGNIYMTVLRQVFAACFMFWPYLPWFMFHQISMIESSSLVGKISPVISHYIHIYIYSLGVVWYRFLLVMFHGILWVFLLPIVVSFILEILVSIPMIVIPFSHYICVYTNIFLHSKKHILLVYPMIFPYDIPIKPVLMYFIYIYTMILRGET